MEQQQLQGMYQILDTEPYLNHNRGQTRHARGPVHDSSVSYTGIKYYRDCKGTKDMHAPQVTARTSTLFQYPQDGGSE